MSSTSGVLDRVTFDYDDNTIGQTLHNACRRRADHSEEEGLSSCLSSAVSHDRTGRPVVCRDASHAQGHEIQRQNSESSTFLGGNSGWHTQCCRCHKLLSTVGWTLLSGNRDSLPQYHRCPSCFTEIFCVPPLWCVLMGHIAVQTCVAEGLLAVEATRHWPSFHFDVVFLHEPGAGAACFVQILEGNQRPAKLTPCLKQTSLFLQRATSTSPL